jgi:hypothetical protein
MALVCSKQGTANTLALPIDKFFAGSFMKPDDSLRFWKITKFSKIQVFSIFESDFKRKMKLCVIQAW